jgi:hypothetical protein
MGTEEDAEREQREQTTRREQATDPDREQAAHPDREQAAHPDRESAGRDRPSRDAPVRALLVRVVFLVAALAALVSGSVTFGPDWSAHTGHGTRGTFTVTEHHCGKGCRWIGTFRPTDAALAPRSGVGIVGGAHVTGVGQQIPAVDTGDSGNVYPRGGGNAWVDSGVLVVLGLVLLGLWVWFVVARPLLRKRRDRRSA